MTKKNEAAQILKQARAAKRRRQSTIPRVRPVSPAEVLVKEFLDPLGRTQTWLASETGIPRSALSLIATGKRGVTAVTALKLARVFGTTPQFWMGLQMAVDLWEARERERGAA
jgi:antitoxin HigA-1